MVVVKVHSLKLVLGILLVPVLLEFLLVFECGERVEVNMVGVYSREP